MTTTTQPEPTLTLWQRFMADTPPLFKKIQLIGIIVAGVCGAVLTFIPPPMLSDTVKMSIAIPGAIGTFIAALSGLVVKTLAGLPANATIEDALAAIPGVVKDILVLKASLVTTVDNAKKGQIDSTLAGDAFELAVQQKLAALAKAK